MFKKFFIILFGLAPGVMATQNMQWEGITIKSIPINEQKKIENDLGKILKDLVEGFNFKKDELWMMVSSRCYENFSQDIYEYIKMKIDENIINSYKDIEHIWDSLLNKNKKVVKKLKQNLDIYYSTYYRNSNRPNIYKYSIDSLEEIINLYIYDRCESKYFDYSNFSFNKMMSTNE